MCVYKLRRASKQLLKENGFRYRPDQSDWNMDIYTKQITLHEYNQIPVLFGQLTLQLPKKILTADVYDNNRQLYAPFYNRVMHPCHQEFVDKIYAKLQTEISKLDPKPPNKNTIRRSKQRVGNCK